MRLFREMPKTLRAVCISAASFLFTFVLGTPSQAQLQVDITRGTVEPLPIAIPLFYGKTPQEVKNGRNIANLISTDLERSGLFRPIDRGAFIQRVSALQVQPRFGDWRQINAQALVSGSAQTQTDGRLKVEFRLWDVFAGTQMTGLAYFTTPQNWRRVAHMIADEIYKRITGESGYFDTRVVYISESGPANRRIKRLSIMDQDGANHQFLTDGRDMALTPRFSPTAQEITYLLFRDKKPPRVFLYNIETGQQEIIGDFPNMTFAPRFSPDGNKVIMSMAKDGNTEVYTMDLRTRRVKRLTNHPAIDTSPSYSPDGRRIVFNSDRSRTQKIYVMNSDGSGVKRISFKKGRYTTPVWSPRGDLIAFTKSTGGTFSIGVMQPDGRGERILANGFLVEGPTWAPNGRVLMFFREQRRRSAGGSTARLYSIDLTGYNERQIPTPEAGSDPAWSPLVK